MLKYDLKKVEEAIEENIKLTEENKRLREINQGLEEIKIRQMCIINNLKNTLLCEDGSADVDELKEMGFNVVIYRQGANKPILLDTQYRKVGGDNVKN